MLRALAAAILALLLAGGPPAAWGAEGGPAPAADGGAMLVDLLVARPLGLVAVVAGVALYLPAALIQSLGGNPIEPVADAFLTRPAEFTFKRPLGQFQLD